MDWATFFKDYGVLVTLVGGLISVFLTFIFTRSHYIRSRKWELEDREFNRRQEILDMRIKEAREYVDAYSDAYQYLIMYEIENIVKKSVDTIKQKEFFDKTNELVLIAIKKNLSIQSLGDKELSRLSEELRLNFFSERGKALDDAMKIIHGEDVDSNAIETRVSHCSSRFGGIMGEIGARLEYILKSNR